jgi:GTP-binding protein
MEKEKPAEQNTAVPFRMQPSSLGYDNYVGRLGIGRVYEGIAKMGDNVWIKKPDGETRKGKIAKVFIYEGLGRKEVNEALPGDIVIIAGIPDIYVGETITNDENAPVLPAIKIDPPTISMTFMVNNSPFAGKEGKLVTTRHIKARLDKEKETNVGLQVEEIPNSDSYKVSGRGELHLAVLIEQMRREGFELQVSRPQVIMREVDGVKMEPIEQAIIDVPEGSAGSIIDMLNRRKGEMVDMRTEEGIARMEFKVPTRGLLGFRGEFIIETRGEGILNHSFIAYEPYKGNIPGRARGSMISMLAGESTAYDLWNLQERGKLFIGHATKMYEGMIIGESAKDQDLVVNVTKGKKLTNMRASGTDEAVNLTPITPMTLEQALEYIDDDELVEITPTSIRLRKKLLTENERKRGKSAE